MTANVIHTTDYEFLGKIKCFLKDCRNLEIGTFFQKECQLNLMAVYCIVTFFFYLKVGFL